MSQKQVASKPLPILEYDGTGRHRIVTQGVTGECEASPWAPVTEAVRFGSLYAAGSDNPFEEALFTIRGVAHQVLA